MLKSRILGIIFPKTKSKFYPKEKASPTLIIVVANKILKL